MIRNGSLPWTILILAGALLPLFIPVINAVLQFVVGMLVLFSIGYGLIHFLGWWSTPIWIIIVSLYCANV